MSTKIYNGFRFQTNNLWRIFEAIEEFREEIAPQAQHRMRDRLAELCVGWMDRRLVGLKTPDDPTNRALQMGWMKLVDRIQEVEQAGKRDPEIDFAFQLNIYPVQGTILGIYHSEQDWMAEKWTQQAIVESYPYWNNTDPPKDVSEQEWNHRRQLWNQALDRIEEGRPAGLQAECVDTRGIADPSEVEELVEHVPTLDARLEKVAKERLLQNMMQQAQQEGRAKTQKVMEFMHEYREWIRSEEGQKQLQQQKKTLQGQIPAEITPDLLMTDIGKLQEQQPFKTPRQGRGGR